MFRGLSYIQPADDTCNIDNSISKLQTLDLQNIHFIWEIHESAGTVVKSPVGITDPEVHFILRTMKSKAIKTKCENSESPKHQTDFEIAWFYDSYMAHQVSSTVTPFRQKGGRIVQKDILNLYSHYWDIWIKT